MGLGVYFYAMVQDEDGDQTLAIEGSPVDFYDVMVIQSNWPDANEVLFEELDIPDLEEALFIAEAETEAHNTTYEVIYA